MRFLLLDGLVDEMWKQVLAAALKPLGEFQVFARDTAMKQINLDQCDVFILDATTEERVEAEVARLRAAQPNRRIVVMTASPDWEHARAVFEAGAIDYLPKTMSEQQLHDIFDEICRKPLPPWPR